MLGVSEEECLESSRPVRVCRWLAVAGDRGPHVAHHSFAAEYDRSRTITVTGSVTKLEWTNPHARLYVMGTDETGKMQEWDFELGPPNGLMRNGWRRDSLKAGLKWSSKASGRRRPPWLPTRGQ